MSPLSTDLANLMTDARKRTLELIDDLTDEQLMGTHLSIVNPLLWEIGHVSWFNERWVLRHAAGKEPIRKDADDLYDSAQVAHDTRWDLPLPSRKETLQYMQDVLDQILSRLSTVEPTDRDAYFCRLAAYHEYMHAEAFTYTRQTLEYPAPCPSSENDGNGRPSSGGQFGGDIEIGGGTYLLGALRNLPFVFDNEKWEHPVEVRPFRISRGAVTNTAFAAFVEEGGYVRSEFWSLEGWAWREEADARHPVYWRKEDSTWHRRNFDRWVPLEPHHPVIHVNWFEASAYCNWSKRRLPAEAEWELAASSEPTSDHAGFTSRKRIYPWGESPSPDRANLDSRIIGCVDVGAFPNGDSAFGCRQMFGNVWEWTSTVFGPYPGFEVDPYKEYSEPWFGTRKVLRGGSWATPSRLLRNTWRNYFTPDRRDVFAGFRTASDW